MKIFHKYTLGWYIENMPNRASITINKTKIKTFYIFRYKHKHIGFRTDNMFDGFTRLYKLIKGENLKSFKSSLKIKEEQKKYLKNKCEICGSKDELTIDHKIPITFYETFGDRKDAEYPENYQTLCFSCNSDKAHKLIVDKSNFYAIISYIKNNYASNLRKG